MADRLEKPRVPRVDCEGRAHARPPAPKTPRGPFPSAVTPVGAVRPPIREDSRPRPFGDHHGRVWTGFHRCIPCENFLPRAPSSSPVRRGLATILALAHSAGHWTNGAHPRGETACPNGQCPRLADQHSFTPRRASI